MVHRHLNAPFFVYNDVFDFNSLFFFIWPNHNLKLYEPEPSLVTMTTGVVSWTTSVFLNHQILLANKVSLPKWFDQKCG